MARGAHRISAVAALAVFLAPARVFAQAAPSSKIPLEGLSAVFAVLVLLGVVTGLIWRRLGRDPLRAGIYFIIASGIVTSLLLGMLGGGMSGVIVAIMVGFAAGKLAPPRGGPSRSLGFAPLVRKAALSVTAAAGDHVRRTQEERRAPTGVFISYRRSDTPSAAGRLYDHVADAIGENRVFKDVDSIPPGVDFEAHIADYIRSGATVLVLIGPRWLDGDNHARLQDPDDLVRREIELAQQTGAKLIPVLIEDAVMPAADALPPSIAGLARINALRLRADPDFRRDVQGLIAVL